MREFKFAIFGAGCPKVEIYGPFKFKASLFDAFCQYDPSTISFTIIDGNDIELYKILGDSEIVKDLRISNSAGKERELLDFLDSLEQLQFQ